MSKGYAVREYFAHAIDLAESGDKLGGNANEFGDRKARDQRARDRHNDNFVLVSKVVCSRKTNQCFEQESLYLTTNLLLVARYFLFCGAIGLSLFPSVVM